MKPKTYLNTLKKTLTQPSYYAETMKVRFWFVFRFFLMSMILLGLAAAFRFNQRLIPQLKTDFSQTIQEFKNNYPPDLTLTWTGQEITTSSSEPIRVDYPSFFQQPEVAQLQLPATLAYITDQELTTDQLESNLPTTSWFVVSQDQLFMNDLRQNWTQQSLDIVLPAKQLVLQKDDLNDITQSIQTWFNQTLAMTQKISYGLIPLFLIMTKFWAALIESLILFLLMKLNRIKLKFKQSLQLSLQITVVAELVVQLSSWLYPQLDWPMFALSYWLVVLYIFWTQRQALANLNLQQKKPAKSKKS